MAALDPGLLLIQDLSHTLLSVRVSGVAGQWAGVVSQRALADVITLYTSPYLPACQPSNSIRRPPILEASPRFSIGRGDLATLGFVSPCL